MPALGAGIDPGCLSSIIHTVFLHKAYGYIRRNGLILIASTQ